MSKSPKNVIPFDNIKNMTLVAFRRRVASYGLFSLLPINDIEETGTEEMEKDVKLFRWVIDRALLDILGGGTAKQKRESDAWVFSDTTGNFEFICDMAYLQPELVKRYSKILKDHYKIT